ncbi:MAG TPA: ATP synthase F0 subunit C [Candidatus Babeliales bacterium]|jgi:F0F1-type ATP synthase membrane subunit c/vacuolar-type H+-ATPase subunit K|nr:ATP synthase F0 subunit C [Candidatus Babeliales bacterium]
MIELDALMHFTTIGLSIALNSLGAGIGEGIVGYAALKASNRQPQAHGDIVRLALIGTALIETTAIIGIFVAFMLLLGKYPSHYQGIAQLGIAFAICLSGFIVGIVSALPIQEAVDAIARQPFFAQKILGFTIITQALIQTPVIVGFIIALIINAQVPFAHCLADALRLISSGLCIGLAGIGPAIGLAIFAQTACHTIARYPTLYRNLLSFTLISQTLVETPVIFAFLVSLMILFFVPRLHEEQLIAGIATIAAALCTGFGTFGVGISSGNTAGYACKAIASNTSLQNIISRISLFAQALIETSVIYAVLISMSLLFIAQRL